MHLKYVLCNVIYGILFVIRAVCLLTVLYYVLELRMARFYHLLHPS